MEGERGEEEKENRKEKYLHFELSPITMKI